MHDSLLFMKNYKMILGTTLGYGDFYPTSLLGRTLSCICALSGKKWIQYFNMKIIRDHPVSKKKIYLIGKLIL